MSLFKKNPADITTKFSTINLTSAVYGLPIPILFGQRRLAGKVFWYGDFIANKAPKAGGSGLSNKGPQSYVYYASVVIGLCHGQCAALKSVWTGQDRFSSTSAVENYLVPGTGGIFTVSQAALFNADEGVSYQASYSVNVNDYGSPGATTLAGTQTIPLQSPVGSPVTANYSVTNGVYTFPASMAGLTVAVSYTYFTSGFIANELSVVPLTAPYVITVTHQNFYSTTPAQGGHDPVAFTQVFYYPSGVPLTATSGTPIAAGLYNPNNGNYIFSPADAGKGVEIIYTWVQPTVKGSAPVNLNMTFISGAFGQQPWGYLTANNPGFALGYNGVCLVGSSVLYLGYSPAMPNYNYEIAGLFPFGGGVVDANPALCIEAILSDAYFGIGFPSQFIGTSLSGIASNYWVANGFFISPLLDQHRTTSSVIGEWLEASQVACFWSEGVLKFVPHGDTSVVGNGATYIAPTQPVVSLNDDDFISDGPQDDPVKVKEVAWPDRYNKVGVRWSVRVNSYNSDVLYAQDDASIVMLGLRQEAAVSYDFICLENAAQIAANLRVQRYVNIKRNYEFKVKAIYPYLEPMDIIEISDTRLGLVNVPVRILTTEDDPYGPMSITAEEFPWSISTAVLYPKQTQLVQLAQDTQQAPGDTDILAFEAPSGLNKQSGNTIYIFVNSKNSSWGGCNIYSSFDGLNYNFLVATSAGGKFGKLVAPLPATLDVDVTSTLSVQMENSSAGLLSVSQASADSLVTLSAIGDLGNNQSLTSYQAPATSGFIWPSTGGNDWLNPTDFGSSTLYASVMVTGVAAPATQLTVTTAYIVTAIDGGGGGSTGGGSVVAGPKTMTTFANDSSLAGTPWGFTNGPSVCMGNLVTPNSEYLKCTGGVFSLPSNATITGIVANVAATSSGVLDPSSGRDYNVTDSNVKLYKAGSIVGGNHASFTEIQGATGLAYGSSIDLWGTTWAYTDVNNSTGFGLAFAFANSTVPPTSCGGINGVTLTVYYTLPTTFITWANPSNAQGAPNSTYAVANISVPNVQTDILSATQVGFSTGTNVPVSDTVFGLTLNVYGQVVGAGTVQVTVQLTFNGSALGSPRTATWAGSGTPFGGTSDLWGTTLTPAILNSALFGFNVFAVNTGTGTPSLQIDAVLTSASSGGQGGFGISSTSDFGVASNFMIPVSAFTYGSPLQFPNLLGLQVDFDAQVNYEPTDGGAASIAVQFTNNLFTNPAIGSGAVAGTARNIPITNGMIGSPGTDNWQHYTTSGPFTQLIDWGTDYDITLFDNPAGSFYVALKAVLTNTTNTIEFRVKNVKLTIYTDASTEIELVAYENATLAGLNEYNVTYLRRGVYGTTPQAWPIGSFFARLNEANYIYQYPNEFVGDVIYLKATSYNTFGNQLQDLPDVAALSLPLQGFIGAFDLLSGAVQTGAGAVAPSWTGSLTYLGTTTTITWLWNFTLLRNNGVAQNFHGSQLITGLASNTTFYFYPYVDDSNGIDNAIVTFVSGVNGVGTPPWAQVFSSSAAAQVASTGSHLPLSDAILTAATTSSGTGGGINGGRSAFFN